MIDRFAKFSVTESVAGRHGVPGGCDEDGEQRRHERRWPRIDGASTTGNTSYRTGTDPENASGGSVAAFSSRSRAQAGCTYTTNLTFTIIFPTRVSSFPEWTTDKDRLSKSATSRYISLALYYTLFRPSGVASSSGGCQFRGRWGHETSFGPA